jgi:HAD superfamily hydrolase (TIGR01484 family)
MKQLIAFDLDGTLAESKQPIEPDMADLLSGLLAVAQVAVISGGDWPQFEKQLVGRLPADADLERLWILPTTGAKLYRRDAGGEWQRAYGDDFPAEERARILAAVDGAVSAAGMREERTWGERIEDRGTQFTFSALGQEAPLDAKKAWDPDMAKRKALQAALVAVLPDLSINIGGSTSIDITRRGVDKGWGLNRLALESGIPLRDMIFLGDAVFPGGNDYPAQQAGVDTVAVRDVAESRAVIRAITLCLRR